VNATRPRPRWVTVLVLLLVPVCVAGGVLWGTGGSDARLRSVEAAVVNNDEMVEVNGQMMPLGRQLAAELVDSDREQNFTWILADPDAAREGLASGRFAAVVTIPKDFSAAATSFAGDAADARRATVHVETSKVAGISETALGQSITDAAANALNRFLTTEYLKNIYVGFNEMGDQMGELADGTGQLADGAGELADGADLSADGAGQLSDGLGEAAAGGVQLRSGASQSADGAVQLADGAGQIADGTAQWAAGAGEFATGVGTYATGAHTFADGVTQYTAGINQIVSPIRDVIALLPEWGPWLDEARALIADLPDRAVAWDAEVQAVLAQLRALVERADALVGTGDAVVEGVAEVSARAGVLASGGGVACPAELDETPGACEAFAQGVSAAGGSLVRALDPVTSDADALESAGTRVADLTDRALVAIDRLSALSTSLVAWAPEIQERFAGLEASLPEGVDLSQAGVLSMLDQLITGGEQLSDGGQQLATGADALADGAQQLATGAGDLSGGMGSLAGGTGQLADGLGQLSDGVGLYTSGITQAADGSKQLSDGLALLADGAGQLADGTRELADGVAGGLDDIPNYTEHEREALASAVASPVSTDGLSALVRPQLAWASLLLVLALWLGAVATFTVVRPLDRHASLSTASSGRLLARSLVPGAAIVAAQALLPTLIGAVALSLDAGEVAGLAAVLGLAGVVFAVVNHALAALFGVGGRLVALAMAVVTAVLAITATAPGLFGSLAVVSPLSPALEAVRAVTTGGSLTTTALVLAGWGALGLGGSLAAVARSRTVSLEALTASA